MNRNHIYKGWEIKICIALYLIHDTYFRFTSLAFTYIVTAKSTVL